MSTSTAFGRRCWIVRRARRRDHGNHGVARARRRRLGSTDGRHARPASGRRRHRDRRARRRVRAVRRRRPCCPPAGHPIGGRSEPAPVAQRREPPPRRVGDRVVVPDRCQSSGDPARLDRRHARLPLARQVDRHHRRVEPPQVGGGDRTGAFRRQWTARPPRFELRQPVLGRCRAGRAHDERCRSSQGRPDRSRLLRLLLPTRPDGQNPARLDRGDHARTGGGDPAAPARRRAARRAGLDVRTAAHVHDGDHTGRVGARCHERHVGGAGRDLRRHAGLRRGRPPLRSGTSRHACRVARPRSAARSDRAECPMDAAPVQDRRALRPRPDPGRDVRPALRSDPRRARRRAVRRRRVRRHRRRSWSHRIDRLAPSGTPRRRADDGGRHRRTRRVGVRESGADLDPRNAAPSHSRGDRVALPAADRRARDTPRDRLRARSAGEWLVDRARQSRQPRPRDGRSGRRRSTRTVRTACRRAGQRKSTATAPSPT